MTSIFVFTVKSFKISERSNEFAIEFTVNEMKQFLAIHHLKRTGNFPTAADQEGLEDVVGKIFEEKVNPTVDLTSSWVKFKFTNLARCN